ncbi:MAG: hypothetical protein ABS69_19105 [Nitrosomonadales bacterium SCN 54-20]|nr:MAG: hypothetical protein ABS69_19105 [Nitrosomonadales bacterium SCN 54-20]
MDSRPAFVRAVQIQKNFTREDEKKICADIHAPPLWQGADPGKIFRRAGRVLSKSYLSIEWETVFHRGGVVTGPWIEVAEG